MATLLNLNDNCVTLTGLFNKITQAFVNDAVATVTIKDGAITLVNAEVMPYVVDSDGEYRYVLPASTVLPESSVSVEINATAGDGSVYHAKDDDVYIANRWPY